MSVGGVEWRPLEAAVRRSMVATPPRRFDSRRDGLKRGGGGLITELGGWVGAPSSTTMVAVG